MKRMPSACAITQASRIRLRWIGRYGERRGYTEGTASRHRDDEVGFDEAREV